MANALRSTSGDIVDEDADAITLCSALFQASILLESAYPIGSEERAIADMCEQASMAIEELERHNFELNKHLETIGNHSTDLVDRAGAGQPLGDALLYK